MSWKDISDIGKNKNFIIGGHSHNHEILSNLPEDLMKKEINTCIKLLSVKFKKN